MGSLAQGVSVIRFFAFWSIRNSLLSARKPRCKKVRRIINNGNRALFWRITDFFPPSCRPFAVLQWKNGLMDEWCQSRSLPMSIFRISVTAHFSNQENMCFQVLPRNGLSRVEAESTSSYCDLTKPIIRVTLDQGHKKILFSNIKSLPSSDVTSQYINACSMFQKRSIFRTRRAVPVFECKR